MYHALYTFPSTMRSRIRFPSPIRLKPTVTSTANRPCVPSTVSSLSIDGGER